jgi:hypothetical protein
MGWGINLNAEGKDSEVDHAAAHAKAHAGEDWFMKHSETAIRKTQDVNKSGQAAYKKYIADNAQYMGIADRLQYFITEVIADAGQATQDETGVSEKKLQAMKTYAMAAVIKEIVEGAEEIKRL